MLRDSNFTQALVAIWNGSDVRVSHSSFSDIDHHFQSEIFKSKGFVSGGASYDNCVFKKITGGLFLTNSDQASQYDVIRSCRFVESDVGIDLTNDEYLHVESSLFQNTDTAIGYFSASKKVETRGHNLVTGCTFANNRKIIKDKMTGRHIIKDHNRRL